MTKGNSKENINLIKMIIKKKRLKCSPTISRRNKVHPCQSHFAIAKMINQ